MTVMNMKIKNTAIAAAFAALCGCSVSNDYTVVTKSSWSVKSPDGRSVITLVRSPFSVKVERDGKVVVAECDIGMKIDGKCLAEQMPDPDFAAKQLSGEELSPVYKKGKVCLRANEGYVDFGDWGVRLISRNDGVAYRFELEREGEVTVDCEKADLSVPSDARCWFNRTNASGCEENIPEKADARTFPVSNNLLISLPFVYSVDGVTVAVSESNLESYPIWNLMKKSGDVGKVPMVKLTGAFSKYPKTTHREGGWGGQIVKEGGRWVKVDTVEDYLVKTSGSRAFPWRLFMIADKPAQLIDCDLVWALAAPSTGDYSWVKPGKVAWDWWNDWNLEGVPFKAGCNTKSYEYYIDFAAKTGVEYVIFDEGWSEHLNIWKFHKDVDVPYLIEYANKKGVGIILWMAWAQAYGDEERVVEHFAKLGAKGFKVDFMDRGDAECTRFLQKFATACAKHKMLVDYHGAYRPVGMTRTWPNILNYEGIHGLEQMKWYQAGRDMMWNDVAASFIRMSAGPMDYTPGAMINYPIGGYKGTGHAPGSMGTRCRQMAMMAIYEAPLQMLCDSPTNYEKNMESFSFMAATPVVWDDSIGLDGCPESMIALARRKGDVWYAAAMTDNDARDYTLDTKFLGEGEWKAEVFRDGEKSATEPMTYVHENITVKAGDKLPVKMAPGGGFVIKFTK